MKLNTLLVLWALWVPAAYCSNGPAVARVNGAQLKAVFLHLIHALLITESASKIANSLSRTARLTA